MLCAAVTTVRTACLSSLISASGYNMPMLCRRTIWNLSLATSLMLTAGLTLSAQDSGHRGRKYKAPPPTSKIEVTVVRDIDAKPIENASVIFHLGGDKGNMEVKTNEDGKSIIDVLPIGSTMTLQVIAKGYQTYGDDFKIDKPQMAFDIRMKRPGEQYSIYKNHDQKADAGKPADKNKSADSGSKDSSRDKQSESASQTGSQPGNSPPQPQ